MSEEAPIPFRRSDDSTPVAPVGRTLPHSIEAEEYLLSCCLLDGSDVVSRCLEARIRPESFYLAAHGTIYERLLDLYNRQVPIDVSVLAEELKTSKQLEEVGGYPFITQVSSRIPTTAQAGYFIEKVRETSLLREIIHAGAGAAEDCYNFSGGIEELSARVRDRIDAAVIAARPQYQHQMAWNDLLSFDAKADPDCLMGKRFLGRTDGAVIVAPSGVGKSVLSIGLGGCAALGLPFFGLQMVQPMRVLYAQAEDSLGDVAEAVQGFVGEYGLNTDQVGQLKQRMRIVRWNDCAGSTFLTRLRAEHARFPFDLAIVNPLFSFCGCSVSEQAEMSAFLRNGFNPILNDTRAAAVIIHHTNKPSADGGQPGFAPIFRTRG